MGGADRISEATSTRQQITHDVALGLQSRYRFCICNFSNKELQNKWRFPCCTEITPNRERKTEVDTEPCILCTVTSLVEESSFCAGLTFQYWQEWKNYPRTWQEQRKHFKLCDIVKHNIVLKLFHWRLHAITLLCCNKPDTVQHMKNLTMAVFSTLPFKAYLNIPSCLFSSGMEAN